MKFIHADDQFPIKVYLAGPMTGIDDYNYPEFNRVAAYLEQFGFHVVNPADSEKENLDYPYQEAPWDWYLRKAIAKLITCDMVVMLNGYKNSKGAQLEISIAESLGMPICSYTAFIAIQRMVRKDIE